jgi:hypothetical protein
MGSLHPPLPPAGSLTELIARKDIVVGRDAWLISMCSNEVLELLRTPFPDVGEYKDIRDRRKRRGRAGATKKPRPLPRFTSHIMLLSRLL